MQEHGVQQNVQIAKTVDHALQDQLRHFSIGDQHEIVSAFFLAQRQPAQDSIYTAQGRLTRNVTLHTELGNDNPRNIDTRQTIFRITRKT